MNGYPHAHPSRGRSGPLQETRPIARGHVAIRSANIEALVDVDANERGDPERRTLRVFMFCYSIDGQRWIRHAVRSEVSGYPANTMDDLAQLRPALYAAGRSAFHFDQFRYEALTDVDRR